MSGEAIGLLLLPFTPLGMVVLGGMVVAGAISAGAQAARSARSYEQQYRNQRPAVRNTPNAHAAGATPGEIAQAQRGIGDFRSQVSRTMAEQTELNRQASESMMAELETQRSAVIAAAQKQDAQAFAAFSENLKQARVQTMKAITDAQAGFERGYKKKIAADMSLLADDINARAAAATDELRALSADQAKREQRDREFAYAYMKEAETLLYSLEHDFDGQKFVPRELALLRAQYQEIAAMSGAGRYEAATAGFKDLSVSCIEEIYNADLKKQEWENYYKLALVLSEEVRTYLEANETVTEEAMAKMEEVSGAPIEEDIAGVRLADYTGKNKEGVTRFDYLMKKTLEVYDALRAHNGENLSTKEVKAYAELLNNELYPAAVNCITKAVLNVNNAYSRQNVSEEIIDAFEDHNFTFSGYAYEDDRHDKPLLLGFNNEVTGEEIIVTLSPELAQGGDIQTRVEIKQIKGDETNEQRKAEYRAYVEDIVSKNNPGARISLQCKQETAGKLSTDTKAVETLRRGQGA